MLPNIDPLIKLIPTIKPRGKVTDSAIKRLTLFLLLVFWTPIIKIKNKEKLKIKL